MEAIYYYCDTCFWNDAPKLLSTETFDNFRRHQTYSKSVAYNK